MDKSTTTGKQEFKHRDEVIDLAVINDWHYWRGQKLL